MQRRSRQGELYTLQVDWPPVPCDVYARLEGTRADPPVQMANTARDEELRHVLDRRARTVGSPIWLAA